MTETICAESSEAELAAIPFQRLLLLLSAGVPFGVDDVLACAG